MVSHWNEIAADITVEDRSLAGVVEGVPGPREPIPCWPLPSPRSRSMPGFLSRSVFICLHLWSILSLCDSSRLSPRRSAVNHAGPMSGCLGRKPQSSGQRSPPEQGCILAAGTARRLSGKAYLTTVGWVQPTRFSGKSVDCTHPTRSFPDSLEEARTLHEQELAIEHRVLGGEHRRTLTTMNNLGTVLKGLGRHDEARRLLEQSLESQRRVLGPEHPDTLRSMNNLSNVLMEQERLDEARKLLDQALEIERRVLGPKHPEALGSMINLALVLHAQGDRDKPRKLYEQAIEAQRGVLGPRHPHTLKSMGCLAGILRDLGRHDEARKLIWESLEIRLHDLGSEDPDTLGTMVQYIVATCAARDVPDSDLARMVELGRGLGVHHANEHDYWRWQAIAEYRTGHWDASIEAANKSIEMRGDGGWLFHWMILALSHARRGEMDQAGEWWVKAQPRVDQGEGLADTPRWLVDEATALFGKTSEVKDGSRDRDVETKNMPD
jgi:tetratricopeptide (TPR) repeat protein